MSNGSTHVLAGSLAGLTVALTDPKSNTPTDVLLATTVGAMSGKFPDMLEPATSPHHRQFFHSMVTFAAVGYGTKRIYDWQPEPQAQKLLRLLLLAAGVGYLSHLILDSMTPMSLPMIGRV